jgi:hypothetical protein
VRTNTPGMGDIPDRIVLKRHRELDSLGFNRPVRYAILTVIGALLVLGLFNVFGQRPAALHAESSRAKLQVFAPSRLRGGLLYEARFTIYAREELEHAALLLSPGWAESQQINTIEPSPLGEASRDGDLFLTLGHIPQGEVYRLFIEFQVNPTNIGHRTTDVALYDGDTRLLTVHRSMTVFP